MNTLRNLKAIAVNHRYTFTTGLYFRYQRAIIVARPHRYPHTLASVIVIIVRSLRMYEKYQRVHCDCVCCAYANRHRYDNEHEQSVH